MVIPSLIAIFYFIIQNALLVRKCIYQIWIWFWYDVHFSTINKFRWIFPFSCLCKSDDYVTLYIVDDKKYVFGICENCRCRSSLSKKSSLVHMQSMSVLCSMDLSIKEHIQDIAILYIYILIEFISQILLTIFTLNHCPYIEIFFQEIMNHSLQNF